MLQRLVIGAVLCAGCGFSVSGGSANQDPQDADGDVPGDAGEDGALVLPDMAIDMMPDTPPPEWVTLETISVPCRGMPQQSTTILVTGEMYRLRASGQCIANTFNDSGADAEYIGWNIGSGGPDDIISGDDVGIGVDYADNASSKLPRWGDYTSSHNYQAMFTGAGATIRVQYIDPNPDNNSGSLSFEIQRFQ